MKSRVAVVILNWNGAKFLEQFLPNVIEYSKKDATVYVADNASTDNSVELLKQKFPEVSLIINPENGGFAKGYNQALSNIDAEYYILLNSDIEVTPNWISPIINLMEEDALIAACQPKILSYHDKKLFEYAGAAGGYIDHFGYPFCRGRIFSTLETDFGQFDDIQEVFWATGACLFIKSDLYWKVGGLDEDFFAHMEEIDLCWRLKNLNYRIMYCGHSSIYHIGGGTLPKSSSRKTYLNIRNNLVMLYKNSPNNQLFKIFFARFFLDGVAAVKFMISGGIKDFIAVIRAHLSFWRTLKVTKKKRKSSSHHHVSYIYKGNIVSDYYLLGKKYFTEIDQQKFTL